MNGAKRVVLGRQMIFAYAFGLVFFTVFAAVRSHAYFFSHGETGNDALFRRDLAGEKGETADGGAVNLEAVDAAAFNQAADFINGNRISTLKRGFDITISLSILAFLAPLMIAVAIAIKLDSPGPVMYRQKRVGFGGQLFNVLKFRSMMVGAESDGPQYALPDDARVTRVGRIIRKFRIDEIPQAVNVLRGEMSFVGPRPERPEFVRELELEIPHYHCRHLIKPGITGWAQVKYEYAASVEGARNKLRYDLYYIRHFSPALDLVILAMTIRVALFGLGSR